MRWCSEKSPLLINDYFLNTAGKKWRWGESERTTLWASAVHDQIPVLSGYPSERAEQKRGREEEGGSQAGD